MTIYNVTLLYNESESQERFNKLLKKLYKHATGKELVVDITDPENAGKKLLQDLASCKITINCEDSHGEVQLDLTEYEKKYGISENCLEELNITAENYKKPAKYRNELDIAKEKALSEQTKKLAMVNEETLLKSIFDESKYVTLADSNQSCTVRVELEKDTTYANVRAYNVKLYSSVQELNESATFNIEVNYKEIDNEIGQSKNGGYTFARLSQAQQKSDLARQAYDVARDAKLERAPSMLTIDDVKLAIQSAAAAYAKYTEQHRPRFVFMYRNHGKDGLKRVDTLLAAIANAMDMATIKAALVACFQAGWRVNPGVRDHSFVSFLMNALQRFDLKGSLGFDNIPQNENYTDTEKPWLVKDRRAFINNIQTCATVAPATNASPIASQDGLGTSNHALNVNSNQESLRDI